MDLPVQEASIFALKSNCSFVVPMRLPTRDEMRVLSGSPR